MDQSETEKRITSDISISVCMIVKNEEEFLPRCLASLKNFADEIVIVDTGSTDHSIEIAQRSGAKVFEYPWEDDFAKARNQSIHHATSTHIIVLDADEQLEANSRNELIEFITQYPMALGRLAILSPFNTEDNQMLNAVSHATRIFPRNSEIFYEGIIHEQVVSKRSDTPRIATKAWIHHDGYAGSLEHMRKKTQRNISLLRRVVSEQLDNSYYQYQLAKSLAAIGEDFEAQIHFDISIWNSNPQDAHHPDLLMSYLHLVKRMQRQDLLWMLVKKGVDLYPDFPDLYFFIAKAMMELGVANLPMIQQSLEICLRLGDNSQKYPGIIGTGSYLAHHNLGAFFESQEQLVQAKTHYQIATDMGYIPSKNALSRVIQKQQIVSSSPF